MSCSVVQRGTAELYRKRIISSARCSPMERRSQHAHGTRSAPIHGIAEDAIAPEASSTKSDTLSTQLAGCAWRAPCNPAPTGKAAEASPERKSASCADRQAAGRLKKNRQAVGGGWRRPTWLLAGQARREAPGHVFSEVVAREKPRLKWPFFIGFRGEKEGLQHAFSAGEACWRQKALGLTSPSLAEKL